MVVVQIFIMYTCHALAFGVDKEDAPENSFTCAVGSQYAGAKDFKLPDDEPV